MSAQLFNNHKGKRGGTQITLTFAEFYDILRERLEYVRPNFDPDAVCQNVCVMIEDKMGIFPNI